MKSRFAILSFIFLVVVLGIVYVVMNQGDSPSPPPAGIVIN